MPLRREGYTFEVADLALDESTFLTRKE